MKAFCPYTGRKGWPGHLLVAIGTTANVLTCLLVRTYVLPGCYSGTGFHVGMDRILSVNGAGTHLQKSSY